ncbi:Phosphatidylinositol 3-kinase VPS34 [Pelomyxa schiedti]|nr:Phosphatidylinositol 3-kinase VPS34 [Pelomyxa schiedti]
MPKSQPNHDDQDEADCYDDQEEEEEEGEEEVVEEEADGAVPEDNYGDIEGEYEDNNNNDTSNNEPPPSTTTTTTSTTSSSIPPSVEVFTTRGNMSTTTTTTEANATAANMDTTIINLSIITTTTEEELKNSRTQKDAVVQKGSVLLSSLESLKQTFFFPESRIKHFLSRGLSQMSVHCGLHVSDIPLEVLAEVISFLDEDTLVTCRLCLTDIIKEGNGDIHKWLQQSHPDSTAPYGIAPYVIDNFVKSCVTVLSHILGIGDRHLENLMLTTEGNLFHIDFGFILGNEPPFKPLSPPMRICKEMVNVMGGVNSTHYRQFKQYCVESYYIIRKSSNLISLFSLMPNAGIHYIALDQKKNILQVYAIKVYCPACNGKIERGSFDTHVLQCPIDCPKKCGVKVAPISQTQHENTECSCVEVICEICHQSVQRQFMTDLSHKQFNCPIDCPKSCGMKVAPKMQVEHENSECLSVFITCEVCNESIQRRFLKDLSHKNDCPIDCPRQCGMKVAPKLQNEHEKVDCLSVMVLCHSCNQYIQRRYINDASHAKDCPIDCPNGCGEKVKPKELEEHQSTYCPKQMVECTAPLFCDWIGLMSDRTEHVRACVMVKVGTIISPLMEENKRLSGIIKVMAEKISQLECNQAQLEARVTASVNGLLFPLRFTCLNGSGYAPPTVADYVSPIQKVTLSGGIQKWVVPQTGIYKITAVGASGGAYCDSRRGTFLQGGCGASISTVIELEQGLQLNILVGQMGAPPLNHYGAGGGGGGTFIWEDAVTSIGSAEQLKVASRKYVLICAGGGGGGSNRTIGGDGLNTCGSGDGGTRAGSGCGWFSDSKDSNGGKSPMHGGHGGRSGGCGGYGGFGGGGAGQGTLQSTNGNGSYWGGGGGGYQGGHGGYLNGVSETVHSGGGYSFCSNTTSMRATACPGSRSHSDGFVIVETLQS